MNIKKLVKLLIVMSVATISCISLDGCYKNKQIVFIPQQLDQDTYWNDISQNLKNSAESQGYTYNVMASKENDAGEQGDVIKEAVKSKPSAIVLGPVASKELYPGLKEAQDNGVPIILIDTDIDRELLASDNIKVTTFVGIDNYKCGKNVADKLSEKISRNSKVGILRGSIDSDCSEKRGNGFRDEIAHNGMNVVADVSTNWSDRDGYRKAKLILESNPDLKAIFAVNCNVLSGAKKAADEANVTLEYGTFDTNEDTINDIQDGKIVCTLDQDSKNMTKTIMEVVNKIDKCEKVEDITTYEGKLITKNNV